MPKYIVRAKETVYYYKEVEAKSVAEVIRMLACHDIEFDLGDITDAEGFETLEIEEENENA